MSQRGWRHRHTEMRMLFHRIARQFRRAPSIPLVLSVILLVSACGSTSGAHGVPVATHAPAAATPTVAAAHTLVWQAHQLPLTMYSGSDTMSLTVSVADDQTAWLCTTVPAGPTAFVAWVTHDRAATWTRTAPFGPVAPDVTSTSCRVVLDQSQPTHAVATVCAPAFGGPGIFCPKASNYLTTDGGATWTRLPRLLPSAPQFMILGQIATYNGTTYGLLQVPPHSACFSCSSALAMSSDGMRTWKRIDDGIRAANHDPLYFQLNPISGELLAITIVHNFGQVELWSTHDAGQHWAYGAAPGSDAFVMQHAPNDSTSYVCGYPYGVTSGQPAPASFLTCSADGGMTWKAAGGPFLGPGIAVPVAIAADGSVLAVWRRSEDGSARAELRRFTPGGQQWESLGALPFPSTDIELLFAAPAGSRTLWAYTITPGSSTRTPTIFTAQYP